MEGGAFLGREFQRLHVADGHVVDGGARADERDGGGTHRGGAKGQ